MSNLLKYKGYSARVEYSHEDGILYGKIEGIADLVNFEADKLENVEAEFRSAVDDYLDFCNEVGKSPDKAYSGSFNIRIPENLHREAALLAARNNETLNKTVEAAIEAYVHPKLYPYSDAVATDSSARKNFFSLISRVKQNSTPVYISSPKGNAVLVSEEDWNAMQETLYLKSIPGMTESILAASKESTEEMAVYDPDQEW